MARTRIGNSSKKDEISIDFKSRAKTTSSLFGKSMNSKLSKAEQSYFLIVEALRGTNFEPTLQQVGAFFAQQYRHQFGFDCIDYNWFNFANASKSVKQYLSIDSNLELARFYAESFEKYMKVRKSLGLRETFPSVSTFKRAWILEELSGSKPKFDGFY